MKRLVTLAIMVAFILGGFGVAQAIEFKAKGDWQIGVMGVSSPTFDSDDKVDEFEATQRVRTTFEFVANENLKGVMRINSGDIRWGGDGLGTEDDSFDYDRAYLDFNIPNSPVNMKVGKQGVTLPGTLGSHILDDQIWAVQASSPITDEVGITIGWGRAEDRFTDEVDQGNSIKNDEFDIFYGIAPITMDGFEVNPFFVYGMKGSDYGYDMDEDIPANRRDSDQSSHVYWAGMNFSVDMFDPIVVSGDFNYGRHSSNISGDDAGAETRGWIAALAAEYHMDMMTPELFVMYESGNSSSNYDAGDVDPEKRGKVMPSISGDLFGMSSFAGSGSPLRGLGRAAFDNYEGDNDVGFTAFGPSGKMAIGARLKDMSFMDDVTHDLQLTYYQGTNHKDGRDANHFTTRDTAWEVTFDTQYQMYENLAAILELGYLEPSLSDGADGTDGADREDDGSFKAATGFRYLF